MAEIQKKKEEGTLAESEEGSRKRKRGDDEDERDEIIDRESKQIKAKDEIENIKEEIDGEDDEDRLNEEADLLEQALDTMQQDTEANVKTREEAEADRRKLLAGELLEEGDEESDEEDETGYAGDLARQSVLPSRKNASARSTNIRSLPVPKEDAELLRKIGCPIVSDEETKILGVNQMLPWRRPSDKKPITKAKITFRTKFDIVELDANGRIVDKGDEDYTPSKKWVGRKAGFEFKLAERGLGYYRTGKKVVVPSNTAY
jgi:hypothetical protein